MSSSEHLQAAGASSGFKADVDATDVGASTTSSSNAATDPLFTLFDYTFTPVALVVLVVLVIICLSCLYLAAVAVKRILWGGKKIAHTRNTSLDGGNKGGGALSCLAGPLVVCGFIGLAVAMVFIIERTVVVLC